MSDPQPPHDALPGRFRNMPFADLPPHMQDRATRRTDRGRPVLTPEQTARLEARETARNEARAKSQRVAAATVKTSRAIAKGLKDKRSELDAARGPANEDRRAQLRYEIALGRAVLLAAGVDDDDGDGE